MPDRTGPLRPVGRAVPLLLTAIPTVLLSDAHLTCGARGLAAEALWRGGQLDVAEVASRVPEGVNEVLDAVQLLLVGGYAELHGEVLTLTAPQGWAA